MRSCMLPSFALLLAALPATAQASYYVRPVVQVGSGGLIDGYVADGPTVASQSFGTDFSATADLGNGQVKSYLNIDGPNRSGQVVGTFGDRVSFSPNAVGRNVGFDFAFDGTISAGAPTPELNSSLSYGVFATLYVYRAGSGVTYANYGNAQFDAFKVIGQTRFLSYDGSGGAADIAIDDMLSGSFLVDVQGVYDVFAGLSLFAATNANPTTITMDFRNTGQLGITTPGDVTYASDSGVLLTGTNIAAVPEPSAWAMMAIGFGAAGFAARRRQRTTAVSA